MLERVLGGALLLFTAGGAFAQSGFPDRCPNQKPLPFANIQLAHPIDKACGLKGDPSARRRALSSSRWYPQRRPRRCIGSPSQKVDLTMAAGSASSRSAGFADALVSMIDAELETAESNYECIILTFQAKGVLRVSLDSKDRVTAEAAILDFDKEEFWVWRLSRSRWPRGELWRSNCGAGLPLTIVRRKKAKKEGTQS